MSGIRAVLFDFGGVIAEEGFRAGLAAIAQAQGLDAEAAYQIGMDAVYDSGFVLGSGSEADFWQLMRQRMGIKGADAALTREVLDRFKLRPRMIRLVDDLKAQGFTVGLLSDQTEWLYRLDERDGFLAHFDRVYISFELGKGKRDVRLFYDVARDLKLPTGQIVFVDDNAGNVQRASQAGMHAILFRSFESLVTDLRRLLGAL